MRQQRFRLNRLIKILIVIGCISVGVGVGIGIDIGIIIFDFKINHIWYLPIFFAPLIVFAMISAVALYFKNKIKNTSHTFKFWVSMFAYDFINLIVAGIIAAFGFYQLFYIEGFHNNWDKFWENLGHLVFWILLTLSVPTFMGIINHFSKYDQILQNYYSSSSVLMLIEKTVEHIRPFLKQDPSKLGIIKAVFDKLPQDFGGVVIGADEKEYIEKLDKLIPSLNESFCATLRGGVDKAIYNINWFFEDSKRDDGTLIIKSEKKIQYLQEVNQLKDKEVRAKRIIILKNNEMNEFAEEKLRDKFFEYNSNVDIYLIDPEKLSDMLVQNKFMLTRQDGTEREITLHQGETSFIWEDYAIFDKSIAVKHNGKNSLYLGINDQIEKMLLPFILLDENPQCFNKLDRTGIYKYKNIQWKLFKNWSDWKV